jgi:hypothetical protein
MHDESFANVAPVIDFGPFREAKSVNNQVIHIINFKILINHFIILAFFLNLDKRDWQLFVESDSTITGFNTWNNDRQ